MGGVGVRHLHELLVQRDGVAVGRLRVRAIDHLAQCGRAGGTQVIGVGADLAYSDRAAECLGEPTGRRRPTPIAFLEMINVGGSCLRLNSFAGDSTRLRMS